MKQSTNMADVTEESAIRQARPKTDDLEALVSSLTEIESRRSPSFSPDASRVAFVSDASGLPQVWIVPTEGGTPVPVTDLNDPVESVLWSPDGEWLAFLVSPGGGMNKQVYLAHPDGSALRRLTDGKKENNYMGVWTPDGRALTMSSNRRKVFAGDAYLVDVATGEQRLITRNRGLGGFIAVTRDGKYGLLYRLVNRGDDNLFLVDLADSREVLLTPHDGPGQFYGKFSVDGKTVYLQSNKDRERLAFAKVELRRAAGAEKSKAHPLAGLGRAIKRYLSFVTPAFRSRSLGHDIQPGEIELLAARDDAVLESFDLNDQGTMAALVWNVAGRSELEFFDLVTKSLRPAPALPVEIISGLSFSKDGNLLVMSGQGANTPPNIWVLNLLTGDYKQLAESGRAGAQLDEMVHPRLVRFQAHDGIELSGWLYRPQGQTSPGPLVLSFHGGPEAQERPNFNVTYQSLLARGISVFAPNIRGSAGFGKAFVNLDNGPLRFNAIRDIKTCADYVIASGVADPRGIGIMGASYGGYLALAGLTEFPDLFAAGADICGIVNFETFLAHTEPWMAKISSIKYGNPKTDLEMLRRLSPIHKIERLIAPTIITHGANDTNVPVSEAEQVVESLKRRGVPFEYIIFSDEGHGLSKTANRIRATIAIVGWFDKHLKAK
jgi:dipeptidyl aminopeptidase/acylaminoacyl peptidase